MREAANNTAVLEALRSRLIVSCQAAEGDPLDDTATLSRIAASVLRGGAAGLRAEGADRIAAFRALTALPIIGIIKRYDAAGDVYITPDFASARAVSGAGAEIIALDCTARRLVEPEPWPRLIRRIHEELRCPVMADIATVEDAIAAEAAGADVVATTLCGYTQETRSMQTVPWALIAALVSRLRVPLIVEGHVSDPADVRRALAMGAHAVVVGSAITRPESITARFVAATRP